MSKNASPSLIGFEPIKFEVGWQSSTVLAQPRQQLACAGGLLYREGTFALNMNVDVVPGFQIMLTPIKAKGMHEEKFFLRFAVTPGRIRTGR